MNPYPKYKDSEVEWIGEVPEHWEILAIFRQFLSMAKGSAAEARSQLYVAFDSGYLEEMGTGPKDPKKIYIVKRGS